MTKAIRIENADTSTYKVVVETWEMLNGEPMKVAENLLPYPTALATITIYSGRWLVVREASE
jgi:hypothetical protein